MCIMKETDKNQSKMHGAPVTAQPRPSTTSAQGPPYPWGLHADTHIVRGTPIVLEGRSSATLKPELEECGGAKGGARRLPQCLRGCSPGKPVLHQDPVLQCFCFS